MDINELIINKLNEEVTLSKKDIFSFVKSIIPETSMSSITWNLHQLKNKSLIHSPGQGIYSIVNKENFNPSISPSLKRLYFKIAKEFPFLQLCVWDSRWFNDLMRHQLFKYYLVIEVEKDSAESVFNTMTDISKKVFLNPDEDIFNRYISNFNEVIIVQAMISESPIFEQNGIKVASLEKLLVDCVADKNLFASQQGEIEFIYKTAASKFSINISRLKRYARRRNQLHKTENLLDKILAKTE